MKPNSNMEEGSEYMPKLNKDVLQEILIRLPDCKSAIRSSAVCKRWFSAVHSANFIDNFNRRLDESDDNCMQFKLLVKHPDDHAKFYDVFSPAEKAGCLDFLPRPWNAAISASCGEFLLLCLSDGSFCICNPFTRQWRVLPRAPETRFKASACGLVLSPNARSGAAVHFKVVLMMLNIPNRSWIALQFCSETRSWTTESLGPVRYPVICPAEPCNGVLYWQEGLDECRGVLALDPLGGAKEYLGPPGGDGPGQGRRTGRKVMARLGAVRGRLWLAEVTWPPGEGPHGLKVWELEDPREWRLVHDARLRLPQPNAWVIGFRPDGGAVFLECGNTDVFRYEFAGGSVEKVGKFLGAAGPLRPFAVAHPCSWPKLIPVLEEGPETRV